MTTGFCTKKKENAPNSPLFHTPRDASLSHVGAIQSRALSDLGKPPRARSEASARVPSDVDAAAARRGGSRARPEGGPGGRPACASRLASAADSSAAPRGGGGGRGAGRDRAAASSRSASRAHPRGATCALARPSLYDARVARPRAHGAVRAGRSSVVAACPLVPRVSRAAARAAGAAAPDEATEVDSPSGTDAMDAQNTHQNTHTKDTKATPGEEEERKAKSLSRFADAEAASHSPAAASSPSAAADDPGARRKAKAALVGRPAQDPASGSLRAGGDGARGERARRGGRAARLERDVLPQKARDARMSSARTGVDVDLSEEGNATKVDAAAFVKLRWNGEFCLRNVGRRPVWINGVAVESGRRARLASPAADRSRGFFVFPLIRRRRAADPEPL